MKDSHSRCTGSVAHVVVCLAVLWGGLLTAPTLVCGQDDGAFGDDPTVHTDADVPPSAVSRTSNFVLFGASLAEHAMVQTTLLVIQDNGFCQTLAFGGCVLGAGMATFGTTALVADRNDTPYAAGMLSLYGGGLGYATGAQVATLVGGDDVDTDRRLTAVMVGGATGVVAGTIAGHRSRMPDAHADLIALNGTVGSFLGYAGGQTLESVGAFDDEGRLAAAASMAGGLLGMYGGHRMGQSRRHTPSDAVLYGTTAGMTSLAALSLSNLAGGDRDAGMTAAFAGGVVGLGLGRTAIHDRHWSAASVKYPLLVSGVTGLASGLIYETATSGQPEAADQWEANGEATMIGAFVGLAAGAVYAVTRDDLWTTHGSDGTQWSVNVHPSLDTVPTPTGGVARVSDRVTTRVTVRATF